jgi:hypothetical protein
MFGATVLTAFCIPGCSSNVGQCTYDTDCSVDCLICDRNSHRCIPSTDCQEKMWGGCSKNSDCDPNLERCNKHGLCVLWVPCTTTDDCGDQNPCTEDRCVDGICENAPLLENSACQSGLYCRVNETCNTASQCLGELRDCSAIALDSCHEGICDEEQDQCFSQAKQDQTPCNDGDVCTGPDTCVGGTCRSGSDECVLVQPKVLVVVVRQANTCIVGEPCSAAPCIIVDYGSGSFQAFKDASSFRAKSPADAQGDSYKLCASFSVSDAEQTDIQGAVDSFSSQIQDASSYHMQLNVVTKTIDTVDVPFYKCEAGLCLDPKVMVAEILPLMDTDKSVDSILVVTGDHDSGVNNVVFPYYYGGVIYNHDTGVGGAGASWVHFGLMDINNVINLIGTDIVENVYWAYGNLMRIPNLYEGGYPACGEGDPDTYKWFPSYFVCKSDPDWFYCGVECFSSAGVWSDWNAHVIRAHYDFHHALVGNHCRDGRQDFGETGVDAGGRCAY